MQSVPICTHIIKKKCLCSWNAGDWSDQNDNWNKVDDETKRKIGLRYKADGEFWMDYFKDFVHEFEEVSICTMGPDFDHDGQVDNANVSIKIQFHKKKKIQEYIFNFTNFFYCSVYNDHSRSLDCQC